ncbi:MAG TPA: hypothetical protein VFJ85_16845 [Acidimicrobiales bacterium]|nr:hypothetical protein [Acidimicrobiales bacterium]
MRRRVTVVIAVLLAAAGCSPDSSQQAATTTTPSTTAAPTTVARACSFDAVGSEGEVTWLDGSTLMAATPTGSERCLVDGIAGTPATVQWSGDGTKVLLNDSLRTAAGVQERYPRSEGLVLSRPTGKSVIEIAGGRLLKHVSGASTPTDITFVAQPTEAIYHPAGRSIVASGRNNDDPVLVVADNLGRDPQVVARGEEATAVRSLAFTASNALLFVGDHPDGSHLHRLELDTLKLTTVATAKAPGRIDHVTTSPFPGGGVAWTQGGACDLVVSQDAKFVHVSGSPAASATPVGWLPDRSLVVKTGCGGPSDKGDLYVVAAGQGPRLLAKGATAAAVRAVLPAPAAPPPAIPDQAPA